VNIALGGSSVLLVQTSRECTPPYLSIVISNLLQPALYVFSVKRLNTYLASWGSTVTRARILKHLVEAEKLTF
jgi:hypothetical protein